MMKKSLLMLLTVAILLLSACGQGQTTPTPSGQGDTPAQTEAAKQPDKVEEVEQFDPSATIEETVLFDESNVKITATGIKYTAYDVKLNLTIENNTDQELSFLAGTIGYSYSSVNGYMVDDGYLNTSIGAGKKANETVSYSISELTLLGITDIADIEIGIRVTDDDYNEYLLTDSMQIKTSLADSYDYATDTYRNSITNSGLANQLGFTLVHDSQEVAVDKSGIRVLSQTLISNSDGEEALLVEVENTSGDMVYVSLGDIVLNGLSVESGTWSVDRVGAGKRRVMTINLSSMMSYSEVLGLDEIGEITYSFEVMDSDYDTIFLPQNITFTVPGRDTSLDTSGTELYQQDGIRIVAKGLAEDSFSYSDDIHLLLLVENSTSGSLRFDVDYQSLSVNGYMTSFLCFSKTVAPGGMGILDVELQSYSLEDNGISGLEDITEVEMTVEIKNDSYRTIAEPVVLYTIE